MADDKSSLIGSGGARPTPPSAYSAGSASAASSDAVYHDSSQSPRSRLIQILFVGLVIVMVLVSIGLSIYKGVDYGGAYLMLGISLAGFAAVEVLMIIFTRRGDLPKGKAWFLYFVGFCIMLEAIFVDVLLYQ